MGIGYLTVRVTTADDALPISRARVIIMNPEGQPLYNLDTLENGLTDTVPLDAPDKIHDLKPDDPGPHYSTYDVEISAPGFDATLIRGVQILDTVESVQPVHLTPMGLTQTEPFVNEIIIPPIAVETLHQSGQEGSSDAAGQINSIRPKILPDVAIPEKIRVHLGRPDDAAQNVTVSFSDYIKNVGSSEIYANWPIESRKANILAETTYALNRIYTEWYPSRGYNFDITNSTAYDQYFVYGRTIFKEIAEVVDELFGSFVRRIGHKEPYFTSYCNGTTSLCMGLSQWGTVDLAIQGMDALQILRHYYPNDVEIATTDNITSNTSSYPGYTLSQGSTGESVRTLQNFLNRIRTDWPNIPQIKNPNGVYGADTAAAVKAFQQTFGLTADGVTGKSTWYEVSRVYTAVKKLSDLNGEGEYVGIGQNPPTSVIRQGARGADVAQLQFLLNYIALFYPGVESVIENASFDAQTVNSVKSFQKLFGLTQDGIVGPATWNKLYDIYKGAADVTPEPPVTPPTTPSYPGYVLKYGSSGENVRTLQKTLNVIAKYYPQIARLTEDGQFGGGTRSAVVAFQNIFGLTPDGMVGPATWNKLMETYSLVGGGSAVNKPAYPGYALSLWAYGDNVKIIQQYLNTLAVRYPSIPRQTVDGIFGPSMEAAVKAYQRLFGLTADGIIGPATWNSIVDQYFALSSASSAANTPIATKSAAAEIARPSDWYSFQIPQETAIQADIDAEPEAVEDLHFYKVPYQTPESVEDLQLYAQPYLDANAEPNGKTAFLTEEPTKMYDVPRVVTYAQRPHKPIKQKSVPTAPAVPAAPAVPEAQNNVYLVPMSGSALCFNPQVLEQPLLTVILMKLLLGC